MYPNTLTLILFLYRLRSPFQLKTFPFPDRQDLREGSRHPSHKKILGGERMDAATSSQKAFIKKLFMDCGVPRWTFNPLNMWNISRKDADLLINSLKIMKEFDNEDLKEAIWQRLEERNGFRKEPKTVDQLEEEEPVEETTIDWLEEQTYKWKEEDDWVDESFRISFRKGVVQ